MPKTIRTAAELLEKDKVAPTGSIPQETVPIATPAAPAPSSPPPGFEQPPVIPPEKEKPAFNPPVAEKPAAVPAKPVSAALKVFTFIKNIHTGELIRFSDGTTYKFKEALLETQDQELAEKLTSVAARHHIVIVQ